MLLYGFVYLLVSSDLLERPRKWFTSVVESPEDAAIAALLAEGTDKDIVLTAQIPGDAGYVNKASTGAAFDLTTKVGTPIVLTPDENGFPQKDNVLTQPETNIVQKLPLGRRLRVFVGKVLSCEMCTAGHCAIPAAGLTIGLALAVQYNIWWLVGTLAFLMTPPTGIGFVAMLDILSPKRASDRIVDAMTDIAQVVLTQMEAPPVDEARFRHVVPAKPKTEKGT